MKIRRLNSFDYRKIKRLVSYLNNDDSHGIKNSLLYEPVNLISFLFPLELKFMPESFVLTDEQEILGLITVEKTRGNPNKIIISKLIFKQNLYEAGKKLVDFVVHKYGAMGAKSFSVTVDTCHDELFNLFINGCGFRQCSCETLWKIEKPTPKKQEKTWRYAQNSDAKEIAQLYNDEIQNIYKPSLIRSYKEFLEPIFSGFCDAYKTRYVIEESKKIVGYFSITTSDNINYLIDITTNSGYELNYDNIINDILCEIARKRKAFYTIIKHKQYTKNSEEFGNYLKSKNYIPIQTQGILIKDFYQPLKESSPDWSVFILGENQITNN